MVREADRVPCQASVLARILKGHVGQEQNLQLLIGRVYTGRLCRRTGGRSAGGRRGEEEAFNLEETPKTGEPCRHQEVKN